MKAVNQTQSQLIREFFHEHPHQDVPTNQVVDWAIEEWKSRTNSTFRHPDSVIRSLVQEGYLIKPKRGYYRYEPAQAKSNKILQFSAKQRAEIFKRDNHKCLICGMGTREGLDLYAIKSFYARSASEDVDSIQELSVENAATLCGKHKNIFIATKSKYISSATRIE